MTYLLSDEGRRALRTLAGKPLLYAFDFDGTLAPISPDRDAVKIPYSVSEWLKELATRATCAVVSGRALADLTPRVAGAVPYLIGNHGIESVLTPVPTLVWADGICAGWKRELATQYAQSLKDLGGEVEAKRYSLTVHYRGAAEFSGFRSALLHLLEQLTPTPCLIPGKNSVNVLPPGRGGKGPAALALMVHLRRIGLFYVGDDETDEDVFGLTERLAMGVRVGRYPESRAQFYLKHQGEIEEVLRFLVHRIDRTPESADDRSQQPIASREAANDQ